MRDQDDAPYIVIERDGGGGLGSFVLGALVGAGLALLFAPKTGAETQEELKEHARKLRTAAEERVRDAQRQLEDRFEDVRDGVQTRFDDVKDAVSAGRSAASDARVDLQQRLDRSKAAYRAGVQAAREALTTEAGEGEPETD
ncbi:MAG TPA: YtxH domain-containing protein [Longimicrobiales bacterium]|nr:YtxH domain-containing protein [Longimicrobiales bacterium]